jgi:hypothetical protein
MPSADGIGIEQDKTSVYISYDELARAIIQRHEQ